jgi:hypothetical protein
MLFHVVYHALASGWIRQFPHGGLQVLAHVIDTRGRRDGTGDSRMRKNELEKKL